MAGERASRLELMQLYQTAIADYQFQVTLTWSRTQYCLTLNAALLSVAGAIYKIGSRSADLPVVGILGAGFLMTVFSILAIDAGRRYYNPVIARIKAIEAELAIPDQFTIRNTPEQGGPPMKITVTRLLKGLLMALAIIDLLGIGYLLHTYWS